MHVQEMNDNMKACAFFSSDTIPKGSARILRAVGYFFDTSKNSLEDNASLAPHCGLCYALVGVVGRDDGHVPGGSLYEFPPGGKIVVQAAS